jgi:signal transduction histidine kinase
VGLAIAKKIVERHGGTIRVEPNEGEGTIMAFTWPKLREAAEVS